MEWVLLSQLSLEIMVQYDFENHKHTKIKNEKDRDQIFGAFIPFQNALNRKNQSELRKT